MMKREQNLCIERRKDMNGWRHASVNQGYDREGSADGV